jgi:hypothetical protein
LIVALELRAILDQHARTAAHRLRIEVEPHRDALGPDRGFGRDLRADEDPHRIARTREAGTTRIDGIHRDAQRVLRAERRVAAEFVARQHIADRMAANLDHGAEGGRRAEDRDVAVEDVVGCVDRRMRAADREQQREDQPGEEGVHAQFPEYA